MELPTPRYFSTPLGVDGGPGCYKGGAPKNISSVFKGFRVHKKLLLNDIYIPHLK